MSRTRQASAKRSRKRLKSVDIPHSLGRARYNRGPCAEPSRGSASRPGLPDERRSGQSGRLRPNPQNRTPPPSSSSSILSVQSVRGKLRHDAFHAANHAATCRVLPQKAEGEEGIWKSANCEYQPTTQAPANAENARRCREIRSFVSVGKLSV